MGLPPADLEVQEILLPQARVPVAEDAGEAVIRRVAANRNMAALRMGEALQRPSVHDDADADQFESSRDLLDQCGVVAHEPSLR